MNRDAATVLVLALLALLALGIAGATLTNPVAVSGDGLFGGSGASGDADPLQPDSDGPNSSVGRPSANIQGPCLTELRSFPVRAGLFLAVFGLSAYLGRRSGSRLAGALVFVVLGTAVFVFWTVLTACGSTTPTALQPSSNPVIGGTIDDELGNTGGAAVEAASAASDPSVLLGILLLVAIGASLALLLFASGDAAGPRPEPDEEPEPEADVTAVGRAAGRAADRIDASAGDFENDVYRAWVEMTDELAVDHPASSTPAEFADAAVAAGMDADDVTELTGLFEEIRYGDYDVTEERESRAVAALRRIESHYADEESTGGSQQDSTDDDTATGPGGDGE